MKFKIEKNVPYENGRQLYLDKVVETLKSLSNGESFIVPTSISKSKNVITLNLRVRQIVREYLLTQPDKSIGFRIRVSKKPSGIRVWRYTKLI